MLYEDLKLTKLDRVYKKKLNLLGYWCLDFNKKNEKIIYSIINKKKKLRKKKISDQKYISELNEKILSFFHKNLNQIHNKKNSKRYWRILLGSFLYNFVPLVFERWQNVNLFFKTNKKNFKIKIFKDNKFYYSKTTIDALLPGINEDKWNHILYTNLIFENFSSRIKIKKKKYNNNFFEKKISEDWMQKKKSFFFKILLKLKLFNLIINFNKYLFDNKILSLKKFFILNLFIKNIFFYTQPIFDILNDALLNKLEKKKHTNNIKRLSLVNASKKFSKNKFERFVVKFLSTILPSIYLEDYDYSIRCVKKYTSNKNKVIFSDYSIYYNEFYKLWVAEMTNLKSKLIIADHGLYDPSFIPANLYFENLISDYYFSSSSFSPKKNRILTPTTLDVCQKIKKTKKKFLTIIHYERSRYNFRLGSTSSESNLIEYFNLKKLIKSLPKNIIKRIKYRSIGNYGNNFKKNFKSEFANIKIDSLSDNFKKTLKDSKIIVSLYLSTPTAEAMAHNIPNIILLPKNFFLYDKRLENFFLNLKKAKIMFDDPTKLSLHLKNIWFNIDNWWSDKEIQNLRKKFLVKVFKIDERPISEYKKLLDKIS